MNIKSHLIAAAAALVMTGATFAGISGYADQVANAEQQYIALASPAVATEMVSYNAIDTEIPEVVVVGHHKRNA